MIFACVWGGWLFDVAPPLCKKNRHSRKNFGRDKCVVACMRLSNHIPRITNKEIVPFRRMSRAGMLPHN